MASNLLYNMKVLLCLYALYVREKRWDSMWDPSSYSSFSLAKCCWRVYEIPSIVVREISREMMPGTVVKVDTLQ